MGDFFLDIIPAPIYRFCYWLKRRPTMIRFWFQRANGKVPACDCWEFNSSLVNYIIQGLDYLLDKGATDWEHPTHKKQYEELDFVRNTLREFIYLHDETFVIVADKEEWNNSDFVTYMTKEEWAKHEKDIEKAFKLLGKWLYGLWD